MDFAISSFIFGGGGLCLFLFFKVQFNKTKIAMRITNVVCWQIFSGRVVYI